MEEGLCPNIKYVIHAVGPDARDNQDRLNCFDNVTRTIGNCLEYAEQSVSNQWNQF